MALSNQNRVGQALECLKQGLIPYIEQECTAVYGEDWKESAAIRFPPDEQRPEGKTDFWDTAKLLLVMWDNWNDVFRTTLGHMERSLVSELRLVRNKWAHQEAFSTNDTIRALDSIARLLNAVSAWEESQHIEKMRMNLMRVQFEEKRRTEMRKKSFQPTEGNPKGGLRPWRDIIAPHPDVASGKYQQAEFAADLWQVSLGEASGEYQNPTEFFRRTYLTDGLSELLSRGIKRLSGTGGDPVVELQTNFGGGKTHSMLALYHLFSGTPTKELPGIEELLTKADTPTIPEHVRRVILVGTKISPGHPITKPDGTVVHTLWGEIAWQLGGKDAYEMIRDDDERATNPGDALKTLFNRYAPCLILIDEWVAYARQLHEGSKLPAGTFETQFTFAQALSESAKAAKQTLLVVSIPASDNEIGGEWGQRALERLKNAVGRVESSWRPASSDEGFEIVRRRLFEPLDDEASIARDAVARAFVDLYGSQHQDFPSECREASYERRIKIAYPIHPELFDRLYNDWSTLDKFQRTRGVLRLMAAVIHSLWERQDNNLLILPSMIPIDNINVNFELTRYLEDGWKPVIDTDIDGPRSLPLEIDRENTTFGRYSACRRVARTIYMGSAPTIRAANKGIDERHVRLGCVQPGESAAAFGDALRRLTDRAKYLYLDQSRYWYSTQPTVTRLAMDRAAQLENEDIHEEIRKHLYNQARTRGEFSKIHVCATGSDIPEDHATRLVILDPDVSHAGKGSESAALEMARSILTSRGNSPRTLKNTLVFLAADKTRLKELELAVRQYKAWESIVSDKEALNLDPFQTRQAETKKKNAGATIEVRIPETYIWLLVPGQPDPRAAVAWEDIRQQGQEKLAPRAMKKLVNEELIITEMGGVRLSYEINKIPLWRGNHVSIRQLMEDFATYLYLPRLADPSVLHKAIKNGLTILTWNPDTFAYAGGFDEASYRYVGLNPEPKSWTFQDSQAMLVKPGIAQKQINEEQKPVEPTVVAGVSDVDAAGAYNPGGSTTVEPIPKPKPVLNHRFYGSVSLNPVRMSLDIGQIADEVVQHLIKEINADVSVRIEIEASLPNGASEKLVRDVSENCRTLKFKSFDFEEE